MKLAVAACTFTMLAASSVAHADLRSFTQTYEYSTQPEGSTSVQLWHTQTRATTDGSSPHFYEGLLELEHGMTERLDVSFNAMLSQQSGVFGAVGGDSLSLSRVELEARYRFADRGELPVDPQIMVELSKYFGDHVFEAEGRVIAARDFGDVTIAANGGVQIIGGKDVDETRTQFLWAAGATYQVVPRLRVGVETWGVADDGTVLADAGPVVCFIASPRFWVAATAGFALSERDEVVTASPTHGTPSVRAIFGLEL